MKLRGRYDVYVGDELVVSAKNKFTRWFIGELTLIMTAPSYFADYLKYSRGLLYSSACRVGTGSDATTIDMTDLVSKIDIAPNSFTVYCIKTSDYTKYAVQAIAVWNPYVLPTATIREIGIYGTTLDETSLTSPSVNPGSIAKYYAGQATRLLSRISTGDGNMSPINYSNDRIFRVEWYFEIKF